MPLVSLTRLRVRSWAHLPAFVVATVRAALQARRAEGNLAVRLLRDAHNTFWTCTLWSDEAAMKAFMLSGAHRTIMPRLLEWCNEAAVARWTQTSAEVPAWQECHERMQRDGRPSKVNHPSEAHRRFAIAAPQVARRSELRFK